MTGGGLHKVSPGQRLRIPAHDYNAFVDAARAHRDRTARGVEARYSGPYPHLVTVKNVSGYDCPRFGVLAVSAPIIDPTPGSSSSASSGSSSSGADEDTPAERGFKNRLAVQGDAIADEHRYTGKVILAREPIKHGKIGLGVIRGVTQAVIDVGHETHTHADVVGGGLYLASAHQGTAQILWKQSGTGELLALVDMGPAVNVGFPALLTGYQLMGGEANRWEYSWKEAVWDSSAGQFIERLGGLDSSQPGSSGAGDFVSPAYNLIESGNQGSGVEAGGVDVGGADYPAGFALVPIRGAASGTWTDGVAPAVWMRVMRDDEDLLVYCFEAMNQHDGDCE